MSTPRDSVNYIGQPYGAWKTTPGWGRYVVLASGNSSQDPALSQTASDSLDNNGNGTVDESGEKYPEVLSVQTADPIQYPWAKVHYKLTPNNKVLLYGDHDNDVTTPPRPNLVNGYPMIVIDAQGGQGTSTRRVEIEAVKVPFQIIDSAMYSESDQFDFNGTQFMVSGQDWDPVTHTVTGNPEVPGIVTLGDSANVTSGLTPQQQDNIEGSGSDPSVSTSSVDLDLQAIRDAYMPFVEYELQDTTYSGVSWGDLDHYTVVHCPGDLHISGNTQGAGLLIVDGNFTLSGSFTWYGLVLVMGDINMTGGGAGIHIYGSVLTQGGIDNQKISGNADLLYSSDALNRLTGLSPYVVYNWKEL
jgi:hypothetical protein